MVGSSTSGPTRVSVLHSTESVVENAEHVFVDLAGVGQVAQQVLSKIQELTPKAVQKSPGRPSTLTDWFNHELHPKNLKPEELINWIFFISTLNFSFWDDSDDHNKRFMVRWLNKEWTGYWSLLAVFHRAISEGLSLSNPSFLSEETTDQELRYIFRSDDLDIRHEIPLLKERIDILQQSAKKYHGQASNLIRASQKSALSLIDILIHDFPSFKDEAIYLGETKVVFYKRAQIFIAEVWAALDGQGLGEFSDIDQLTMFADYRVPQILHSLGTMKYSNDLEKLLITRKQISNGSLKEIEIRAISIQVVELIRQKIQQESKNHDQLFNLPNAIELDFWLWDLAKEREESGHVLLPHHRTRSIYY